MGRMRVTARWLRKLRRTKWDPLDEDRTFLSTEMLPEDLQDFQNPMVIVGFDVESLHPRGLSWTLP